MAREVKIENIRKHVELITDGLGMPIDPGIKNAVVALMGMGFPADGSCEGHIDRALPFPWVDVCAPAPKNWQRDENIQAEWKKRNLILRSKLEHLLGEFYEDRKSEYPLGLRNKGIYGAFRVQPAGDEEELQAKDLKSHRTEMNVFSIFLLEKLNSS